MAMIHNYSAGPCILPKEVFQEASNSIINFNGLDLSLIEISHRSQSFVDVMDKAIVHNTRKEIRCERDRERLCVFVRERERLNERARVDGY